MLVVFFHLIIAQCTYIQKFLFVWIHDIICSYIQILNQHWINGVIKKQKIYKYTYIHIVQFIWFVVVYLSQHFKNSFVLLYSISKKRILINIQIEPKPCLKICWFLIYYHFKVERKFQFKHFFKNRTYFAPSVFFAFRTGKWQSM